MIPERGVAVKALARFAVIRAWPENAWPGLAQGWEPVSRDARNREAVRTRKFNDNKPSVE